MVGFDEEKQREGKIKKGLLVASINDFFNAVIGCWDGFACQLFE